MGSTARGARRSVRWATSSWTRTISRSTQVVVEKRSEVKKKIRLRKDIVRVKEAVEGDVRREEVEIDDDIERRTT